jgi:serine/threonine protein kinase
MQEYRLQKLGQPLFDQCNVVDAIIPVSAFQARAAQLPDTSMHQLLFDCKLHNVTLKTGDFELNWRKRERSANQYTHVKDLGAGSYGAVSKQVLLQNGIKTEVAVKKFKPDVYDFNELDLLMRFKHPNVIHATDFFLDTNDQLNIVMPEAITDMERFMRTYHNDPRFTLALRASFVGELENSKAYLQTQGIFHCDLKPANVLVMIKDPKTSRKFNNIKVVLADMSLCFPYSVGTKQPCGTEPYTAMESKLTLQTDIQHPASYQAIDAKIKTLTKQMLSTDMFLLGNTCLFILTGRHFFDYYGTPAYQQSIEQYVSNPDQYITDLFAQTQLSASWQAWFAPLFAFLPSARPTEYLSLLTLPLGDVVTTGFAAYDNFVSSTALTNNVIKSAIRQLKIPDYGFTTLRPEIQFSTLQMFFRVHSKMKIKSHQQTQKIMASCIDLACQLAYEATPLPLPQTDLYEVVDHLNGQLRYSYIVECCHTPLEIEDIVKLAQTNPQKFLDLLHDPVAYFNNVRSKKRAATCSVDDLKCTPQP